jgi:DNA processing protein
MDSFVFAYGVASNGITKKSLEIALKLYSGDLEKAVADNFTKVIALRKKVSEKKITYKPSEVIKELLEKDSIKILTIFDINYPESLKHLDKPPLFLTYKGDISLLASPKLLTVVGSRMIQPYTIKAMKSILNSPIQAGLITVSGLAMGTDALAHLLSVDAGKPTIAVLGSGMDKACFYPKQNYSLFSKIVENGGLVLSEYLPSVEATRYSFPERNRIVAALSGTTFVAQAQAKSGSLITADFALELGKDVLTIPADIFYLYYEANIELIKRGAIVVSTEKDILDHFKISLNVIEKQQGVILPPEQQIIFELCSNAISLEQIIAQTGFEFQKAIPLLTTMELQGFLSKNCDNLWEQS